MNRLPIGLRRWLVKFTTGCIGNRHKLHQRGEVGTAKCPNCSFPIEKSSHVLLCSNQKTKSNFNLNLAKIRNCLSTNQTLPRLQRTIITILKKWRNGRTITKSEFTKDFGIRDAIEDQANIGWNNFVMGRWSKKWRLVQQRYIKQTKSKRSSLRWTTSIINKLLNVVWDIWNFRNSLIHGMGGINDRARHKELNTQIKQQFEIGFNELLLSDHRNYRRHKLHTLLESSQETKQNWIRNLNAARLAFTTANEIEEENIPHNVQTSIVDWLNNMHASI